MSTITTECLGLRLLDGALATLTGLPALLVLARHAALGREDGHARALADHLELRDGVGALQVGGDEHGRLLRVLEVSRELARERRLPGALEAREHDDGRAGLGERQRTRRPAEYLDELLVDDLDDLLRRVERAGHLAPRARSRIAPVNVVTTGSATSASSRARRISRMVASMSASLSLPLPRRLRKVAVSRSDRQANTCVLPCEAAVHRRPAYPRPREPAIRVTSASGVIASISRCAVGERVAQLLAPRGPGLRARRLRVGLGERAQRLEQVAPVAERFEQGARGRRRPRRPAGRELREHEVLAHQGLDVGGELRREPHAARRSRERARRRRRSGRSRPLRLPMSWKSAESSSRSGSSTLRLSLPARTTASTECRSTVKRWKGERWGRLRTRSHSGSHRTIGPARSSASHTATRFALDLSSSRRCSRASAGHGVGRSGHRAKDSSRLGVSGGPWSRRRPPRAAGRAGRPPASRRPRARVRRRRR